MESIKEIFRIGNGPSSSHTIGPRKAASIFFEKHKAVKNFRITLFGALAATGKGHLTDKAIIDVFKPIDIEIVWKPEISLPEHPNGLLFEAFDNNKNLIDSWQTFSVGGGALIEDIGKEVKPIYPYNSMSEILEHLNKTGLSFWEFVEEYEGKDIFEYLNNIWNVMQDSIHRGLDADGILPGSLRISRKASTYHVKSKGFRGSLKRRTAIFSYALAVAEENACGGLMVTAPTCGSCGVLPSVLYHLKNDYATSDAKIIRALATAGIIGNLVKKNASISGAKVGCQGEIGTACSMAAAAATQLWGGTPAQIEYAAEMGLEHHLGLTCDPIAGLVQIPCIERNAFAAARAIDASAYAIVSDGRHRISFDTTVLTMNLTGHDLPSIYKETSEGGLAFTAKDLG